MDLGPCCWRNTRPSQPRESFKPSTHAATHPTRLPLHCQMLEGHLCPLPDLRRLGPEHPWCPGNNQKSLILSSAPPFFSTDLMPPKVRGLKLDSFQLNTDAVCVLASAAEGTPDLPNPGNHSSLLHTQPPNQPGCHLTAKCWRYTCALCLT